MGESSGIPTEEWWALFLNKKARSFEGVIRGGGVANREEPFTSRKNKTWPNVIDLFLAFSDLPGECNKSVGCSIKKDEVTDSMQLQNVYKIYSNPEALSYILVQLYALQYKCT